MARKLVPEQHESKRREILAAAHRCFLRHGLQGASVAVICNEAGISPGHLYHYFPSKEAIVEQMADDYLAGLHAHFARHTQGEPVATVLLSELWSMEGWDDLAHCRILFELLAEGGRNDKIVVDRYDDPKVSGVSCYLSRAETGGIRGTVGLATDPSRFSIACRATGPVGHR